MPEGRPESSPAESVSPHPVGDSGPGDWDAAFPTRVVSLCAPLSQSLLLLPCNLPASPAAALRGVASRTCHPPLRFFMRLIEVVACAVRPRAEEWVLLVRVTGYS